MRDSAEPGKSKSLAINWGNVGLFLSSLCAVHCVAMPFIIMAMPFIGLSGTLSNPALEFSLIGTGFLLSMYTVSKDAFRHHRKWIIVWITFIGFALLIGHQLNHILADHNHFHGDHFHINHVENAIIIFGALLVGLGIIWNNRVMRAYRTCNHKH